MAPRCPENSDNRFRLCTEGRWTSVPQNPLLLQWPSKISRLISLQLEFDFLWPQCFWLIVASKDCPRIVCVQKRAFELGFATEWAGGAGGKVWFGEARAATWVPALSELRCHKCGKCFQSYHPLKSHKNINHIRRSSIAMTHDPSVLNPPSTNCWKNHQGQREKVEKGDKCFVARVALTTQDGPSVL